MFRNINARRVLAVAALMLGVTAVPAFAKVTQMNCPAGCSIVIVDDGHGGRNIACICN